MPDPAKVLCLHGCNQTKESFQNYMKHIVKMGEIKHNLEFIFIDAKYDHPKGGKTWYNQPLNIEDIGVAKYNYDLTNDALIDLSNIIAALQPTVLLGFSQGANVVDTFMSHCDHLSVKKVVLLNGYSLIEDPIVIESNCLSVVSDYDTIVPSKLDPVVKYTTRETIKHNKGHVLPTSKPMIRNICTFMEK